MHITASVFTGENEFGLRSDYDNMLEELVPFDAGTDPAIGGKLHNPTGEDNADAHHSRQRRTARVLVKSIGAASCPGPCSPQLPMAFTFVLHSRHGNTVKLVAIVGRHQSPRE